MAQVGEYLHSKQGALNSNPSTAKPTSPKKKKKQLEVMVPTCDLSTREADAGGSQVGSQSRIHTETLSQKKKE
jgi:hypothetical protein